MCYDDSARPPLPPGTAQPTRSEELALTAADGNQFAAYLALPVGQPSAQLLILPDVRGLHQFYKELALRFAEVGIATIALDYFGRTAGIGARDESFEFWPHVQQVTLAGFFADAAASLAHLTAQLERPLPAFSVGFCMGGALSFHCGTQDLGLAGVIGFYAGLSRNTAGGPTMLEQASAIKVPALGLFGGDDPGIPADQIAAFDAALDVAAVSHEVITYPGAPHSFFDRRATDFAADSDDAWQRVLGFIRAQSPTETLA